MTETAFNRELFAQAVNAMPMDVLAGLRKSAAARFAESGFPTTRLEDWRYTNLARAVSVSNTWLENAEAPPDCSSNEAASVRSSIDAHWISIRNGKIELDSADLPSGVSITLLSEQGAAWEAKDVAVDDAMTQFNAALLADGLRVSVTSAASIEKPIGFLLDDHATDRAVVTQTRVLIDVQAGASVQFIEAHVSSGDGEHFANNVIQIDVARDASADYLRIQQRARHHIHTARLTAELAENAVFRHCAIDLGGSLVRNDVVARLYGRDADVSLNGLYLVGHQQHIDNHTRVDHLVGPSRSAEEYRGILNGKSRGVFNGKAVVHTGADGTDASQSNHNLLLSGDAEIDTKPQLEIYTDEVKCSHGATVGQLDEAALFYLRARGLDEAAATRLMTRAFAAKVLSLQTIDAANDYTARAVDERLNSLIGGSCDE
jgi:Fe-S cluster assembly protein SufD